MKHRVIGKKLNRDKDHRKALMKNLASSLLINGKIETTLVKAKFIRPFVEKLITKAKDNSYTSLRLLRSRIGNEEALRKLFTEVAPSFKDRNGGYTRILRVGKIRKGDNSELATIELVTDLNSNISDNSVEVQKEEK
jgi:large subunit ribosomal protein L17